MLFDALPFQRGSRTENAGMAYLEALRGVSIEAIQAGIRKFLRGECEGVSPKFVPTPPELARIVRTAIVAERIPPARQIAAAPLPAGERARMKLKMPLFAAAFSTGRIEALAQTDAQGFEATIALAQAWGVPIAPETWEAFERPGSEAEWRSARNRGIAEMERSPSPFMRRRKAMNFEDAA